MTSAALAPSTCTAQPYKGQDNPFDTVILDLLTCCNQLALIANFVPVLSPPPQPIISLTLLYEVLWLVLLLGRPTPNHAPLLLPLRFQSRLLGPLSVHPRLFSLHSCSQIAGQMHNVPNSSNGSVTDKLCKHRR